MNRSLRILTVQAQRAMDTERATLVKLEEIRKFAERWEKEEPIRAFSDALRFLRPFRSSKP